MGFVSPVSKVSSIFSIFPVHVSMNQRKTGYALSKIDVGPLSPPPAPALPRFAYLVSGSKGSAWTVLSHSFVEFCVWGWDNLPRTLLMYYTNFLSSPEGYFQTVVCNVPEFAKTVVNHDLLYISWDKPPKQHPHVLTLNDSYKMVQSNAPFARKFNRDDPVLDKIDKELLGRAKGSFTPGAWCSGKPKCSEVGDLNKIKPGPGAQRFHQLTAQLSTKAINGQDQCK